MDTKRETIEKLKKEKNAVILAHYYAPPEVQEIADYIGGKMSFEEIMRKAFE